MLLLALAVMADSCRHDYEDSGVQADALTLNMRWSQGYATETTIEAETGIKWCVSYLGAELPAGSFARTLHWTSGTTFSLHLAQAGFSKEARQKLQTLVAMLRSSDEYKRTGSIDIGRFIALTIGSANHYYAITGAATTLTGFKSRFTFDLKQIAITQSVVSKAHRLIDVAYATAGKTAAFVAIEGFGRIDSNTFSAREYETIDIMKNGQLRVGIYSQADGKLRPASDTSLTQGGKPAKCLWCHELNFNPSFSPLAADVPGYYSIPEFQSLISNQMNLLSAYRSQLNGDVDFSKKQEHQLMELLYISFMEPSAARLALEWNMSVQQVQSRMAGLPTHVYPEFPILGQLYYRKDADARAPYSSMPVPDRIREPSAYEPDLLK